MFDAFWFADCVRYITKKSPVAGYFYYVRFWDMPNLTFFTLATTIFFSGVSFWMLAPALN